MTVGNHSLNPRWVGIFLTLVISLVSVVVAWGDVKKEIALTDSKVMHQAKAIAELKTAQKELVTKANTIVNDVHTNTIILKRIDKKLP